MTERHLQCDKCGREWHSELLSTRIPCPSCGGALRARSASPDEALAICRGLLDIDWCIGYELTEPQHEQLDRLRDRAAKLLGVDQPVSRSSRQRRDVCILDCDSPSYPPDDDEYRQCGCSQCRKELRRLEGARK